MCTFNHENNKVCYILQGVPLIVTRKSNMLGTIDSSSVGIRSDTMNMGTS